MVARHILTLSLFIALFFHNNGYSQPVQVGKGSYSTTLPSGEIGPQYASGGNVLPKISQDFSKPAQTNDFWSSLIYPFYGDNHSNNMYAHPLLVKARANGLEMGYTTNIIYPAADYFMPYSQQITVGITGLNAQKTTADDYGDWTSTALWIDGTKEMKATFGHGLPFVFFEIKGGNAEIKSAMTPTIWSKNNEVVGLTVDGKHYGVFAPVGSTWSGTSTLVSTLNGKNYLSVALLPDNKPETLEVFRLHAYSFVTNSVVSWNYDEQTAKLTTTYTYETEQKEAGEEFSRETLTALYRHQWMYTDAILTNYTYTSVRGKMKLMAGNSFSTKLLFSGILPSLPDEGDYNREDLLTLVKNVATETIPVGPSYENGKAINRFAQLVNIADQLGAIEERDYFLSEMKRRLEDWFTAGGEQEYSYNDSWDVLTGYPSGFGADNQINDHHFHSSYAIMSSAIIAQFDPEWAKQENWGGMVNMLIKDGNNWDRTDNRFPFLRSHDSYAGHSWAAGHGDFGDGNNQESSSESMNFASAVFLWGSLTDQKEIRDLGIFLHTNETTAVDQYWFDVDNQTFPEPYQHVAIGMVWGGKGVHSTWFGANPEFIHGINMLPITSGSLYLGRHPEYVKVNYDEIVKELNGKLTIWQDVIWEYLALSDPNLALSLFYADNNYEEFDGESRAHTVHWLNNLKKMGHLDTTVTASIPTYSVFKNAANEKTYVAFNPSPDLLTVNFSDGFSMDVEAGKMKSENTRTADDNAPIVLLITDKMRGKVPLTIQFTGSKSFDKNDSPLTYSWDFGNGTSSSAIDTSYTFTEPGDYKIMLTVTNTQDIQSKDSLIISVLGNGTPFPGTPFVIPGKLEAENYDKGGEGVAYHDVDVNNVGLSYRPDEGVDLISLGNTHAVYWMVAGEWLEYTISVSEDGYYDISPYLSTVPAFGNFTIRIDNEDVSGKINVTSTGSFESFKAFPIIGVPMKAGTHILRFEIDSDSDKKGWLFSLNHIVFTKNKTVSNELDQTRPFEFSLNQNFPNPFNPSTTIGFSLPKAGAVKLTIYNSVGQRIQVLSQAVYQAGTHEITFDASHLSSGMYFYQLKSESGTATKKMLLMK